MSQDHNYSLFGYDDHVGKVEFDPFLFKRQLLDLFRFQRNPKVTAKTIIFCIGVILTPLTLLGVVLGYCRAYQKLWKSYGVLPRLYNLPLVFKVSMAIGALLVWTLLLLLLIMLRLLVGADILSAQMFIVYCVFNTFFSSFVFFAFRRWLNSNYNLLMQRDESGTAAWATSFEMREYLAKPGIYLGGSYGLSHKGHIITLSSTRGGKGVNLIVNNLLGVGGYKGSWVVIDPKGELAAICSRHLRESGKNVVILNPWDLLSGHISGKSSYNPLDLLADTTNPHLIDDVSMLAEMIVPLKVNDINAFFFDSARNIIAGLLLHIVCSGKFHKPTLTTLWECCRLAGDDWDNMLADMATSKHPVHGKAIRNAANEVAKQMQSTEAFASIMSNALEATNFLKSSALQDSLESGFDPKTLTDGNTVVFVTTPVDKLKSHSAWLKLVTISMMRSVVRNPTDEKVTFLMDEAASALGYLPEIETALAAYAGFNITLWLVYQDMGQVKAIFGDKWESVIANCDVRQFFSVRDNFTLKYISEALGTTTRTLYKKDWLGNILEVRNSERALATPDEVKAISKDNIILFTGENPAIYFPKHPYYKNDFLIRDGKPVYDRNPYIKDSK